MISLFEFLQRQFRSWLSLDRGSLRSRFLSWWMEMGRRLEFLVTPNAEVEFDYTDRDYVRTTLIIIIICFVSSLFLVVFQAVKGFVPAIFSLSGTIACILAYFLARSKYYRVSAWLISSLAYAVLGVNYAISGFGESITLMYSVIGFFMASLVLPPRHFFMFFGCTVAWYVLVFTGFLSTNSVDPQIFLVVVVSIGFVITFSGIRFSQLKQIGEQLEAMQQMLAFSEGTAMEAKEAEHDAMLARQQAEEARSQADKANEMKTAFLATVSHELRTPLNAIIGFGRLLMMGKFGSLNDEQKIYFERIHQNAHNLLELIDDVLDLSKIASGSLRLILQDKVDMQVVLEGLDAEARVLLADKPVNVYTEIDEVPLAMMDARRVRQIVKNFLSNATKFTLEGSITLRLRFSEETQLLEVQVQDTGLGIEEKNYARVFAAFEQSASGLRLGGTGLGMPISKALAEAHGGRIAFESVWGEGSTFSVYLPLKPAQDVVDKYYVPDVISLSDFDDDAYTEPLVVIDPESLQSGEAGSLETGSLSAAEGSAVVDKVIGEKPSV